LFFDAVDMRGYVWLGFLEGLRSVSMSNTYTAITKQDGEWWIGWIEEIPGAQRRVLFMYNPEAKH
jgi:hypothetical protein